jgi:dUTP pyrophosphatase
MEPIKVPLDIEDPTLIPAYASPGAAGMDVRAAVSLVILPGQTVLVPTGVKVAIPEGYELQVRPRSGLSLKTNLRVSNAPGTIDSDYRDEIKIIMTNRASLLDWPSLVQNDPDLAKTLGAEGRVCTLAEYFTARGIDLPEYTPGVQTPVFLDEDGYPLGTIRIEKGDRIAQIVLSKVVTASWEQVDDVTSIGINRGGGFGSTGKS